MKKKKIIPHITRIYRRIGIGLVIIRVGDFINPDEVLPLRCYTAKTQIQSIAAKTLLFFVVLRNGLNGTPETWQRDQQTGEGKNGSASTSPPQRDRRTIDINPRKQNILNIRAKGARYIARVGRDINHQPARELIKEEEKRK